MKAMKKISIILVMLLLSMAFVGGVSAVTTGYSDLSVSPNTALVPGDTVTAVFKLGLLGTQIGDTDQLTLSSPLINAKWEIKVFKGEAGKDAQNPATTLSGTSSPNVPYKPPMFSIDYGDKTDITLVISFTGKVSDASKGQAINVFTAQYTNAAIGSLTPEKQVVYDTSNVITNINQLNKLIETIEKRAATGAEKGVDTSSVTRELADAKAKASAAKAAGSGNALTAYKNIDAGNEGVKKAERALALAELKAASANLGNVTDTYNTLYAMNKNSEAQFLETKVTSLKYTYDTLSASYNAGNVPDSAKLEQLLTDTIELRAQADNYIIEANKGLPILKYLPFIIGGVVGVLLIVGIVILIVRKKKNRWDELG